MTAKKDYTREESFQDCVATAIFTFVATALIGIGVAFIHWPKDRSESAYYKGEAAATAKYKGEFTRGWDAGVKAVRDDAADSGKAGYRIDPKTGEVKFVWK